MALMIWRSIFNLCHEVQRKTVKVKCMIFAYALSTDLLSMVLESSAQDYVVWTLVVMLFGRRCVWFFHSRWLVLGFKCGGGKVFHYFGSCAIILGSLVTEFMNVSQVIYVCAHLGGVRELLWHFKSLDPILGLVGFPIFLCDVSIGIHLCKSTICPNEFSIFYCLLRCFDCLPFYLLQIWSVRWA